VVVVKGSVIERRFFLINGMITAVFNHCGKVEQTIDALTKLVRMFSRAEVKFLRISGEGDRLRSLLEAWN
jgi:hypothetical protein